MQHIIIIGNYILLGEYVEELIKQLDDPAAGLTEDACAILDTIIPKDDPIYQSFIMNDNKRLMPWAHRERIKTIVLDYIKNQTTNVIYNPTAAIELVKCTGYKCENVFDITTGYTFNKDERACRECSQKYFTWRANKKGWDAESKPCKKDRKRLRRIANMSFIKERNTMRNVDKEIDNEQQYDMNDLESAGVYPWPDGE